MADLAKAYDSFNRGDIAQAERLVTAVLRAAPKDSDALLLRAQFSIASKEKEDAVRWLRKSANAAPQRADIQYNVGLAFNELKRWDDAARRFEAAIGADPSFVAATIELGKLHLDRFSQPSVATDLFRRVTEANPDCFDARYHLAKALFKLGEVDEAIASFRAAQHISEALSRSDSAEMCLKNIAVIIPGSPTADNQQILDARLAWAKTQTGSHQPLPPAADLNRDPNRPLILGYTSSFYDNENWMKPVWALLNEHDRPAYQIRIFSFGPLPGGENPGSDAASAWRPHDSDRIFDVAALSNEELAKVIRQERVDLLIDLNGYSDPNRLGLFALRPAPINVGWFNMYATTGLPCFDYLIGDNHVVLPSEESFYTECIARVPGSYLTFQVAYKVPDIDPPPNATAGHVTFGSLASRYKITPQVIAAWSEILKRCPTARLLLRNAALEKETERKQLLSLFAAHGIESTRLDLLGRAPHFEFLETYSKIDIALDTFPYNGGTTTTEAIWQGVPVIAFAGPTWASRTSTTILREANLADWVASDLARYIELAVSATSPPSLQSLAKLRPLLRDQLRRSPVCDTRSFARAVESLCRQFWNDYLAKNGGN